MAGALEQVHNRIREQIESGKMHVPRIVVNVNSRYRAHDIANALYEAFNAIVKSWLDGSGNGPDAIDARVAEVEVCVGSECAATWILVNAGLSDHEVEKLVNALARLIDILAPSLRPTA